MGDPCFCLKSRKPRIFITFCCLFSVCIGVMSSLFFYYPDGLGLPAYTSPGGANSHGSSINNNFEVDDVGLSSSHHNNKHSLKGRMSIVESEKDRPDFDNDGINDDPVFIDYEKSSGHGNGDYDFGSVGGVDLSAAASNSEKIRHHSHHHNGRFNMNLNSKNFWKLDELEEKSNVSNVIENRLLHLDFKGAAPKMLFVKDLMKLAKVSGITGLLIEWEDSFPWNGSLSNLSLVKGGYTQKEAEEIVNFAERNLDLDVIPLVQTFGHVEFALKGQEYRHLREIDEDPQAFCPSKDGTMVLIREMIDQTLELHKNARFVHIGCDEVYNLRLCRLCTVASESSDDLFLKHIIQVANYIRSKGKVPIIWDDMLRKVPLNKLIQSGIGSLVEPMVWVYAEEVDRFVGWEAWEKYATVFPTVWAAAAFKGAFGETLSIPPLSRHADNTQRWIDVIARESPRWKKGVGGLVLTGWQRYDHFAVLCELLPASVPSLVYTSLVLSTPGGSDSIRNRIFVPKNNSLGSETTPTSSLITSTSSTETLTEVLTDLPSSSENPTALAPFSVQVFKRSASNPSIQSRRKIPHPRSLMAKDKDSQSQLLSKFSAGLKRIRSRELLVEPVIDKNEIISRRFVQLLHCPNHHQKVSTLLKESDAELSYAARCNFPGVAFFRTLFRLRSLLVEIWDLETKINRKRGWVTPYNIRHNYSLPLRVDEVVFSQVPRLRRSLGVSAKSVGNSLKSIFRGETILEWIEQNIWEAWKTLDKLEKAGTVLKSVSVWPRRPVHSPPQMILDLQLSPLDLDHEEL